MARGKKAKDPAQMPYGEAVQEVETILESIDREEIDIDELSEKVERAVALIRVCRDTLRATESRVLEVLTDLEPPPAEPATTPTAEPSSTTKRSASPASPSKTSEAKADPTGSDDERPPIDDFAEEEDGELPF